MPRQPGLACVFQMWNNSKSPIRYMWEKVSHCHIIEVEPCTGMIGSLPVGGCGLPRAGYRGTPYKTLDTLWSNPALAWKEIVPVSGLHLDVLFLPRA